MGRKRVYASGKERVRAHRARRKAEAAHRLDAPTPSARWLSGHEKRWLSRLDTLEAASR